MSAQAVTLSSRAARRAALSTTLQSNNGTATAAMSPTSTISNESKSMDTSTTGIGARSLLSAGHRAVSPGGGNRVFRLGSSIGTDSSMIAANNRMAVNLASTSTSKFNAFHSITSSLSSLSNTFSHARTIGTRSSSTSSIQSLSTEETKNDSMDDEYGEMTTEGYTFTYPGPFELESGEVLSHAELRYMTYGKLNEARDNVLIICHALTGNASLHSWWGDLLGPGQAFDTSRYFVVCANILGSCYGSTGPASPILAGGELANKRLGIREGVWY